MLENELQKHKKQLDKFSLIFFHNITLNGWKYKLKVKPKITNKFEEGNFVTMRLSLARNIELKIYVLEWVNSLMQMDT